MAAKKKPQEDYAAELQKCHDRWQYLYEHGGSDPFWPDGCNMNLVHNHCIYYRRLIEENYAPEDYPEIYFKDIPPKIDDNYMARPNEIRAAARRSLSVYKTDPDYQYIRRHRDDFTPKTIKKLYIDSVLSYVSGLEHDIAADDLVAMRRHEYPERYADSFASCARHMREAPPEQVQMTLFSLSADGGDGPDYDDETGEDFGEMAMT